MVPKPGSRVVTVANVRIFVRWLANRNRVIIRPLSKRVCRYSPRHGCRWRRLRQKWNSILRAMLLYRRILDVRLFDNSYRYACVSRVATFYLIHAKRKWEFDPTFYPMRVSLQPKIRGGIFILYIRKILFGLKSVKTATPSHNRAGVKISHM